MSAARARSRDGGEGARAPGRRRLALALLSLLLPLAAAAQRLPFNVYDAEDGLTGTQIWDVREDRRGLLWIAGTWGFSSFDGARFSTLSVREGLPSPNARVVLEDRDGRLWLGTNAGVARFDGRTVVAFAQPEAPRQTVWAAAEDAEGRLWFGTENGLFRFVAGEFRRFGTADGLASDYVYALRATGDGRLWIGSRGAGLTRCRIDERGELAECRVLRRQDGLGDDAVRALAEDEAGRLLVGTRGGGVSVIDGERIATLGRRDGLPSDDIYALLVRRDGSVVIGTADRGLVICLSLEPLRCRTVREVNGLPDDGVRSLVEDHEGSLWVGTEGGLAQLVRDDLWSYGEGDALGDRNVYAVAADGARGLWVGTTAGLVRLAIGAHGEPTSERIGTAQGLPAEFVWTVHVDRRRDVWVGTESGVCRLRGPAFRACERPARLAALAGAYVFGLGEDATGALWVGATNGLHRIRFDESGEPVAVDSYSTRDGLASNRTYAIACDGHGTVWFAHGEALSYFADGRFQIVGAADGLRARSVRGLGVDAAGRLLVGGYEHVARVESGAGEPLRLRSWVEGEELAGHMVLTLAEDDRGRLLLGTNRGVALFDPEAHMGAGAVVAHLDSRSGAIATEVSHSAAFARGADGRSWFGFKGGLTGTLGAVATAPPAPRLLVSRLESKRGRTFAAAFTEVGAMRVGWLESGRPTLPHDDRSLRIWVRAPTYVRRDDLRFQFRLADVDSEWSGALAEPFRDLMNLAPGRHRFEARAAYTDGAWGEPTTLDFEIRPAWWQTPATPAVLGAVAIALLALAARWRVRRIERLELELERRISQRTEDLARYATALGEHLQTVDRVSDRARRAEQARRDLFARASHELRTPLTAVLGFSELLERSLGDRLDDKERRYLTHVRESGELLLRQVNEVLEHFRLESGRVELHLDEVDLEAMVESVVSLMEGFALHRGVRIAVRVEGELPRVRVDIAKLRQVLMNLLSNAIKYSPADETVELVVRPLGAAETSWRRAAYEIAVHDRGAGIPAEEREAIFEPYRRLAEPTALPGTGLGLPIARQLVGLLGGTLTVDSGAGRGSSFVVRLPAEPDPEAPLAAGADSGSFDTARAQVVVVEADWARFAELTRRFAAADVLAVRVESVEALGRKLAALRPQALVVPFDPAEAAAPALVATAIAAARGRGVPLLLLATVGGRGRVLAFARVLGGDAGEVEMRLALRAAGAAPRSFGRRPLVLVAAPREVGVAVGVTLSSAGCDHFRVEGAEEALAALAETAPDAVVVDLGHAFGLAADAAPRRAAARERVVGRILLDLGLPDERSFAALATAVVERGEEPAELLHATVAPLLGDAERTAAAPGPAG